MIHGMDDVEGGDPRTSYQSSKENYMCSKR